MPRQQLEDPAGVIGSNTILKRLHFETGENVLPCYPGGLEELWLTDLDNAGCTLELPPGPVPASFRRVIMEGVSPWRRDEEETPAPFSQGVLLELLPPSVEEVVAIFDEEDLDERQQHRDSELFSTCEGRDVLYDCPAVKRVTVVSCWGAGSVHANTFSRENGHAVEEISLASVGLKQEGRRVDWNLGWNGNIKECD